MYGDVNVAVNDGNLGRGTNIGTGIHVKIGISNVDSSVPILITGSMNATKIKEKLGDTPLADACMDAVEWGAASIYNIPVKAGISGEIGEVTQDKAGNGSIEVKGSPNNAYDVVLEVIDGGGCNEGSVRYSLDGGNTYTEEETIPLDGEISLAGSGLIVKFTDTEDGNSFCGGDKITFSTTSPAMNNQDVIQVVEGLIHSNLVFEFIHIVGTSARALWASLATLANDFLEKYKRPLFFVCEARPKGISEGLDEYVNAMVQESRAINSMYIQVVCSHARYQRINGRIQDINAAGIVTGLYGKAKESQSIGEVKSFPISEAKLLKLLPEGIEDYISVLDEARYLTIRQYAGREDYYVTGANMLAPEGSDYFYAEDVRVSNRLVRAVRAAALNELQAEVSPDDLEASLAGIQAALNIPMEDALRDKIISSGKVTVDTGNLNILVDETLDVNVTYVPMGHVRAMNLIFSVENPYAS